MVRHDESVIQFDHVTKQYGSVKAVDDMTFGIARGEICGFLGPNGAGKTTSLRMLLGLVRPTSGTIWLHGMNVQHDAVRALEGVGAIIEESRFYPYLTGEENIRQVLRLRGLSTQHSVIQDRLAAVGLRDAGNRRVKGYSLGMRQRLALALAMIQQPNILILDEPMNGLDPAAIREFRDHLKALQTTGVTILLSSHLLSEVDQLANRLVFINHGQLMGIDHRTPDAGQRALLRAHPDQLRTWCQGKPRVTEWLDDGSLVVTLEPPETISDLIRSLVSDGIDLLEVRPYVQTLEDQYLSRMTGEESLHGSR